MKIKRAYKKDGKKMKRRKKIEKAIVVGFFMMSLLLLVGVERIKEVSSIKAVDVEQEVKESPDFVSEMLLGKMNEPSRRSISSLNGTSSWRVVDGVLYIGPGELNGEFDASLSKNSVNKIVFEGPVKAPRVASNLFYNFVNTTEFVNLNYLDTSSCVSSQNMFYNMSKLTSIDLSGFNTNKITNMVRMFNNVSSITSLDLSSFDTRNVTDMTGMFSNTSGLTSINLSSFNTSKVKSMSWMFSSAIRLSNIDLSNFDTSSVNNMSYMFYSVQSQTNLDLSIFDTSNVTDMSSMFESTSGLTSLNLSSFNTAKVSNMKKMFQNASGLPSLDLSIFDTSNVTDMSSMFQDVKRLYSLDLSSFKTSNVTDMNSMFYGASSLPILDLAHFKTSKVTNMLRMFQNASSLISLDVSNFDTINVTKMDYMFSNVYILPSLDVTNFNTSNVTNMQYMFNNVGNVTSLDLGAFNTSKVINMNYMFYNMKILKNLNISNFNTSNLTTMESMFSHVSKLSSLDVSHFNTSKVTNMNNLFYGMTNLINLDVSSFDTKNEVIMNNMYGFSPSLSHVKLGPTYVFKTDGDLPNTSKIFPYYGKWQRNHVGQTYTPSELSAQYVGGTMSGDWYWSESKATIESIDSTISTGDTWNPAENFVSAKDDDGNTLPFSRITVAGTVNTEIPGVYDVTYKNGGLEKTIKVTVVEKKVTLTVKHRDESGNPLFDPNGVTIVDTVTTMIYGRPYTTSSVVVTGYSLTGNSGSQSGTVPATDFIVTYIYKGSLSFKTIPKIIEFDDGKVLALDQTIQRKITDWEMMIRDTREIKSPWRIQVSLTSPFKNTGGKILPNALRYVTEDGSEITLSSTAETMYSSASNVSISPIETAVKWSSSKGLVVKTKAGEVERGSYEAEVKWVLVDAP